MNLDRFDGYPGGEEQRQRKPTALERWLALGFDPAEAVGEVGEVGALIQCSNLDIESCMNRREKKEFASSDAVEVRE